MGQRARWLFAKRATFPAIVTLTLVGVNGPPVVDFVSKYLHQRLLDSRDYKEKYGQWRIIDLPKDTQVNGVHAALLDTGKVLIIAGSGNDRTQFEAGTFKTLVYDPATGHTTLVPTPTDVFCAGHAFLPDGKLLVAGGTLRYEVLKADAKRAAGAMTVINTSRDGVARKFPQGTEFVAPDGRRYRATSEFTVKPAEAAGDPAATAGDTPAQGRTKAKAGNAPAKAGAKGRNTPARSVGKGASVKRPATPSRTKVWVQAVADGAASVSQTHTRYQLTGETAIYGEADKVVIDKENYQGRTESYEFNPRTERYERVSDLNAHRWYPTLTGLSDGKVLAVSGLDQTGGILDGSQNEIFDPATKKWTVRPELKQYFPTYPALFQTAKPGQLFFSGSNSGFGPAKQGRDPGFWDLNNNTLHRVPGLRDPDMLEYSESGWSGPVQQQTIMVVGGGGVGESPRSTGRIDLIKLDGNDPHFVAGPSLPEGTRYPNLVQLPDDTTLITGGSRDYRGKGASDNHTARIFHPDTATLSVAADPEVGRDYHSSALLLPDGRVLTLGGDSLYKDKLNTISGSFEKRLEIYTPAYRFHGPGPVISDGPAEVQRGTKARFATADPASIAKVRLIRPSAATHSLNLEQRTVALDFVATNGGVEVSIPKESTLVPPGFYMLFLTDRSGVPSTARWVQVS